MKNIDKKAFTLVELLVAITILAIISVVAYQNFGGATDKANSARKISDVTTIETALQQYKINQNYYPPVDVYSDKNKFGYKDATAQASNSFSVTYNGTEVATMSSEKGGGKIMGKSGDYAQKVIGGKGTISQATLGKQNLSKDLYDVELGDIKVGGNEKFIDRGVGRYVYAIYKKPTGNFQNNSGDAYNIAYVVKKDGTDEYMTKIVGDYDEQSCYAKKDECPATLIGSGNSILVDGQSQKLVGSDQADQGIPYPLGNF